MVSNIISLNKSRCSLTAQSEMLVAAAATDANKASTGRGVAAFIATEVSCTSN